MTQPNQAAGGAHPPEKKKGGGVGKWIWATLIFLVGLIVLFMLTSTLIPEVFSGFNNTLAVMSTGFTESGVRFNLLGASVGVFGSGLFGLVIRIAIYVWLVSLVGYFMSIGLKKLFSKDSGGGAPAAAH